MMKALLISFLVVLGAVAGAEESPDFSAGGNDLKMFHADGPYSPFRRNEPPSWNQMLTEDKSRMDYLSSLAVGSSIVRVASGRGVTQNPTYVVRARIGTPPQTLLVAVDTGNDAAWIPCSGCDGCSSATFAPSVSTTFKPARCGSPQCALVPGASCGGAACGFNVTYGSSDIVATVAQDTVALAGDSISGYTFGCVKKAAGGSFPAQGLLGLGRGPLSLIGQSTGIYKSTFSYCLPSFKSVNFTGSLRLGPTGQPKRIKTTPLRRNPRRSSLYYADLVGIKVGGRIVDIPASALAFNPVSGAGTVVDSGTVFTTLVKPAYTAVRDEIRRRMGNSTAVSSLGGFDTCYAAPIVVPTITFMFAGLNVTLPQENFIIHSSAGAISCLAMAAAAENGINAGVSVIGSFQQQNHRILIDAANSKLGVARELCS